MTQPMKGLSTTLSLLDYWIDLLSITTSFIVEADITEDEMRWMSEWQLR